MREELERKEKSLERQFNKKQQISHRDKESGSNSHKNNSNKREDYNPYDYSTKNLTPKQREEIAFYRAGLKYEK